jgi:hypothetical protein
MRLRTAIHNNGYEAETGAAGQIIASCTRTNVETKEGFCCFQCLGGRLFARRDRSCDRNPAVSSLAPAAVVQSCECALDPCPLSRVML